MIGSIDGWIDGWIGCRDSMYDLIQMIVWMSGMAGCDGGRGYAGWINGWINRWLDAWSYDYIIWSPRMVPMVILSICDGCMDGLIDGWIGGYMTPKQSDPYQPSRMLPHFLSSHSKCFIYNYLPYGIFGPSGMLRVHMASPLWIFGLASKGASRSTGTKDNTWVKWMDRWYDARIGWIDSPLVKLRHLRTANTKYDK